MNEAAPNPLGHRVDSFLVFDETRGRHNLWVGADLALRVPPIGRFTLELLTKRAYLDEAFMQYFQDRENPHFAGRELGRKEPFVLNDDEITDEILTEKFQGRVIKRDLASSLWYVGPSDEE